LKAIQLSIEEDAKVATPDQILRAPGTQVGLKNIGNSKHFSLPRPFTFVIKACYFNALIQQLFQIDDLVQIILGFCPPYNIDKAVDELEISDPVIVQRKKVIQKNFPRESHRII